MYQRVIPRDLFNESSLLKCYGRLYICLETQGHGVQAEMVHDDDEFVIDQDPDSGGISIVNVHLMVRGVPARLHRPLNSRAAWPLYLTTDDDEEVEVFDGAGNLSPEMLAYLKGDENETAAEALLGDD